MQKLKAIFLLIVSAIVSSVISAFLNATYLTTENIKTLFSTPSTFHWRGLLQFFPQTYVNIKNDPYSFLLYFSSIFLIMILIVISHKHMVSAGALSANGKNYGRISINSVFSLCNPIRPYLTLKRLHEFHHILDAQITFAKREKEHGLESSQVRHGTAELLKKAKEIIDTILGDDVSVHIKLFDNKSIKGTTELNIKRAKLSAYLRIPSKREEKKNECSNLRKRNKKEIFNVISGGNKGMIIDLKKEYPRTESEDDDSPANKKPRISSAYNHVLQPHDQFFICNNLKYAEKKGVFYSNSYGWEDFYASKAVFLICPPRKPDDKSPTAPLGMFVVDSYSKYRMSRGRLKDTAGILAHRFYDFLNF